MSTRLRCDPTDYAKKQQDKKDRAKDLREQRQRGFVSDDHTFAPKVNAKPAERDESDDSTMHQRGASSFADDGPPIRPMRQSSSLASSSKKDTSADEHVSSARGGVKGKPPPPSRTNNNVADDSDSLDSLSRTYPKKQTTPEPPARTAPLEPEHDTLFREVKRATGKELDDLPIRRAAPAVAVAHSGPCLRNSSCTCPKCTGMGDMAPPPPRPDPPARRREPKADVAVAEPRSARQPQTSRPSDMENSLSLLKSKMSRRKARSAPSNQASLFVEKSSPQAVAQPSRRAPPPANPPPAAPSRRSAAAAPPPAKKAAPPPRRQHDEDEEDEEDEAPVRRPPPISSNTLANVDEYAEDEEEKAECDNCHRKFNLSVFEKHERICAKVFSGPKRVFDMAAKRLEGTEAEKLLKQQKSKGGKNKGAAKAEDQPLKTKSLAKDWKQQSNMLREAMQASRGVTKAMKEGKELPPMKPSAIDPSLIQCDHCQRRFNEKAAERHIPFCKEKSQRDTMNRGPPPKKGAAAAPPPAASKPTKAAAPKKR